MRSIGINLFAVKNIELQEYINILADLGINYVFAVERPIDTMVKIADMLAAKGLAFETVHAPFKGCNSMWLDDDEGDAFEKVLLHSIDSCVAVNAKISVVHVLSGTEPPAISELGLARFTRLVDYAAGKGVNIAFENTRLPERLAHMFDYFADAENVGFCFDSGHELAFTPGADILGTHVSRLLCTHLHDNDGSADQHILPFDGVIDFERIARIIKESGYKGCLMLEAMKGEKPIYENVSDYEFLERAATAVKRIRQMVDGE